MIAPSGEQFRLAHGDQEAVVVEVGGGLRAYRAGDRDVLDGYDEQTMATSGRGQVLIPWPNRVEDGRYRFDGREHQLPITEVATGSAIHGLVRWGSWRCSSRSEDRVVLEHALHAQPGYPFTLALRVEYRLGPDGLRVETTASNAGDETCPYGSGQHPYLTVGTATVDEVTLHLPATRFLHSGDRGLPADAADVAGTRFDFREPRRIGDTVLDTCFTGLERDGDGMAWARLEAAGGRTLELWAGEVYRYLQVFTGDPLADVRRRSLALEPMTCPPNALRTGEDIVRLEPGRSLTTVWGLTPRD
jgi:aldose 1-epimerase